MTTDLCEDCPPPNYPTDETRCSPCPRRGSITLASRPPAPTPSPEGGEVERAPQTVIDRAIRNLDYWSKHKHGSDEFQRDIKYAAGVMRNLAAVPGSHYRNPRNIGISDWPGGTKPDASRPPAVDARMGEVEQKLVDLMNAPSSAAVAAPRPSTAEAPTASDAREKALEEALRKIAFKRPIGPTPSKVPGALIEEIEKIAVTALKGER